MRIRVNGTTQPVRQRTKVSYDPQHGLQIGVPWECAGDNLAGVAAAYERLRIAYDYEPNGKKSTLIAHPVGGQLGIPNKSVDEWQLLPNELQSGILDAERTKELPPSVIVEIRAALAENRPPNFAGLSGQALADATFVHAALLSGRQDHFAISQQVLHHNTNVWDGYPGNVANVNQERIYTTAQLLAECGNANYWVYPIPAGLVGAIEAIEEPPEHPDWIIGWRKLRAKWATAAGNRITVSTEYWHGQWLKYYYDPAED
jgi:hypothetical protein